MTKARPQNHASGAGDGADAIAGVLLPADSAVETRPIWFATPKYRNRDLAELSDAQRAWLESIGWKAEAGAVAILPGSDGCAGAVLGLGDGDDPRAPLLAGTLPRELPAGDYHFATALEDPDQAALAWAMGAYAFTRYKTRDVAKATRLKLPPSADGGAVRRIARAVAMGRDLINTPANDLGPAELEHAARALADAHGAEAEAVVGDDLIARNFPLIHAVGRASDRPPRLIELVWGEAAAPKVTLVGKGICFDTGGLNLKPAQGMALMKKDMAGAATALALAGMIMDAGLALRLRVLVPAADNAVSANAYRPGDVLTSRNGMSVEIGNTDAEGRLVLADALSLADEDAPDIVMTFATLTGAARVALGPDLPPLYSTNDALADALLASGRKVGDPLWRMPFWAPYDRLLKGKVADVSHISVGTFAGSVTAALFLKRFVTRAKTYVHLDIYGWVPRAQPARPEGGDPQGARAVFDYLSETFIA